MGKKRAKKKRFKFKHLILLFIIFGVCRTLISQRIMRKNLINRKLEEERQVIELQEEIYKLNEEINDKDSLEFVEKVAREDLRMVKPREIIYIDKNKDNDPFLSLKKQ